MIINGEFTFNTLAQYLRLEIEAELDSNLFGASRTVNNNVATSNLSILNAKIKKIDRKTDSLIPFTKRDLEDIKRGLFINKFADLHIGGLDIKVMFVSGTEDLEFMNLGYITVQMQLGEPYKKHIRKLDGCTVYKEEPTIYELRNGTTATDYKDKDVIEEMYITNCTDKAGYLSILNKSNGSSFKIDLMPKEEIRFNGIVGELETSLERNVVAGWDGEAILLRCCKNKLEFKTDLDRVNVKMCTQDKILF